MTPFHLLILIFFILVTKISAAPETILTDKIAALVNHNIILDSDIQNYICIMQYDSDFNQRLLQNKLLYYKILNMLIINNLIFQTNNQNNTNTNFTQSQQIIKNTADIHNMTMDQFRTYINNTGLNYNKYHSFIQQETLKQRICNNIAYQRLFISSDEMKKFIHNFSFVDFNKQFKLKHIIINLPIQATFDQIRNAEDLAKSFIKKRTLLKYDIETIVQTYYNKNNILPRITIQKTNWTSWKNILPIFDQYLQTAQPGDIIGPIYSYDGIHILEINDIRFKQYIFPIVRLKINRIISKDNSKNIDIQKQLLKIKKQIENKETTFNIIAKEKSKDFYLENYENYSEWIESNHFNDINIEKILLELKKNQISMPIYTKNGWCLIKLIDLNQLNRIEIMRERVYLYMLHQQFNEIIDHWIQELKSESYIKIIQSHD